MGPIATAFDVDHALHAHHIGLPQASLNPGLERRAATDLGGQGLFGLGQETQAIQLADGGL